MAEQRSNQVNIERIENLSIVSLKVSSKSLENASNSLQLAPAASTSGSDPRSLWFGPDRWLLVSGSKPAGSIVSECDEALADVLHNAVDYSSGLAVFRLTGPGARNLLAAGSGVDFRADKFPAGYCCRTRLAQIAAIIAADGPEQFDIYVDRSYGTYINDWLEDSLSISVNER